jgi:methyl-accepting chemotaxis protein/aerotaxis receptor
MRDNQPVTTTEVEFPDGEPLVSRTDPSGRIVFANQVFVETSGFTKQELLGAPHNIVRHPHMPAQAFANLWATIKAGRPWDGLVKNRTKSGDFYWVRANVTPVVEDGEVKGYISIRSKPSQAQIKSTEQVYAAIRAGTARHIKLADGELVPSGPLAWLAVIGRSVLGRLLAVAVAAFCALLTVGWLGLAGMAASNDALRHVYERDLVSVNQLREILDRIRDSRNLIAQMTIALDHGEPAAKVLSQREPPVRANLSQIATLWRVYQAGDLTPEQRALAEQFGHAYAALVREVVDPAFGLARRGDMTALNALFETHAPPLFQAAFDSDRALVQRQISFGEVAYHGAVESLRWRLASGIITGVSIMAVMLGLCWALLVTIRRTTRELEEHFAAINRGNLAAEITRPAAREFRGVISRLRAMRAHLAFKTWESADFERRATQIRRETVERMAQTIERDTGSAVETVAMRMAQMARDADAMAASAERVDANANHVARAADAATRNAQLVAAASEELVASIREVSGQVDQAREIASGAARHGAEAQETIRSLSQAAERIGAVVRLIADIASKTNLLALNATIEAARAGESGKGFAVVAGEVKALAAQTARATQEISQQITGLRDATERSVVAVDEIGRTLEQVAQVAVSVATSVEQQSAATQEIARNVTESGAAVQEVTHRITEVSAEAGITGEQAGALRQTSEAVADDIAQLRGALVRTVRTASADADRRLQARKIVVEHCTLIVEPRGTSLSARLADVSSGGAAVVLGDGVAAPQHGGTLVLDNRGGARCRFGIRAIGTDGLVHVQFDRPSMEPAFERALKALLDEGMAQAA